jgi:hypothetical protein
MTHTRRNQQAALAIALALTWLPSCNTPDSVAKFTSSAVATLGAGDAFFDDMKASCVREAQTREPFGAFAILDPSPAACDNIAKQAEGLKAASKLLSSYFTALNDLASFGSTKAGDGAKELATKASAQAKLGAAPQKALGSVAGFLTGLATSAYQQKKLADAVATVHGDVKAVLDGLGEAVGVAYLQQLQDEEKKTATRYQEFLLAHQGAVEATLVLDSRWESDRAGYAAKQKAAEKYQAALSALAGGNEDLAAHARNLKAKELAGLLSPYAAQLESMVPAIQKAFF